MLEIFAGCKDSEPKLPGLLSRFPAASVASATSVCSGFALTLFSQCLRGSVVNILLVGLCALRDMLQLVPASEARPALRSN
jgi:hypothetical protein